MVDASVKHINEYVVLPYLNGMCNGLQRLKKIVIGWHVWSNSLRYGTK